MLGLAIVSFYAGIKFLRLWRKFREESLFHLGVLFLEFVIYMVFIAFIFLISDDVETSNYLLKRYLGIIYTILGLEMSLFYLTTFINRRSLWEKYVPYTLGITFGIAVAVMLVQDTDPWYNLLMIIVYILPFIPVSILALKMMIRIYTVYTDPHIIPEDKSFVMAIGIGSVFMFVGALFDMVIFWIIIITDINFWYVFINIGGIFAFFFLIIAGYVIRRLFINIEKADVVHLMNLLS
jgi:hypothetical protein